MRYNFKNIFMSLVYKNTNEQLFNSLKEYNDTLSAIKEDLSANLNRLKYLCLNAKNLSTLLEYNISKLNINDLIDPYILDDIHLININYPSDDKIIEQLFISNTLIQSIEKNCIMFNKYINIVQDIKLFLCDLNINSADVSNPYFKFFKDKKGFPIVFLCDINTDLIYTNDFSFNIYGLFGNYTSLNHLNDYIELILEYNHNAPNCLALKKFLFCNNSNYGDLCIKFLSEILIPELNNLIHELKIKNKSKINKLITVYTNNCIDDDFNSTKDFYKRNGFTFDNNNFYLKFS